MPGVRYHFKAEGADDVTESLDRISQKLQETKGDMNEHIAAQKEARKQIRSVLGEQRLQRDLYMAQHPALLRFNRALGFTSSIMRTAVAAQNAYNLTQLVFNQKTAEATKVTNDLRQAQRAYDLALKQGKTGETLAGIAEDLDYAKAKQKEFNDQMQQQKIGNILQLATTFGFLASSIGHVITKAPEMISLFRRFGGLFGGSSGGGGFGGTGGITGTGRSSGGSGGGFGGISGATPIIGGRCMSMCEGTQGTLARKVGEQTTSGLVKSVLPVAVGTAAGVATGAAVGNAIKGMPAPQVNVDVKPVVVPPPEVKVTVNPTPPVVVPAPEVNITMPPPTVIVTQSAPGFYEQQTFNAQKYTGVPGQNKPAQAEAAKAGAANRAGNTQVNLGLAASQMLKLSDPLGSLLSAGASISKGIDSALGLTGLSSAFNSTFNGSLLSGQPAVAPSGAATAPKTLTNLLQSMGSKLKTSPIPAASGFEGMVSKPTHFIAGEAGPEHVSISPGSGGGSSGGNVYITVQGSIVKESEIFDRMDSKYLKRALRKRSMS